MDGIFQDKIYRAKIRDVRIDINLTIRTVESFIGKNRTKEISLPE